MLIFEGGFERFLRVSYVVLRNARDNGDVLALLRRYRFDETRLDAALALHEQVMVLHNEQQREYGEQFAATDALYAAWGAADELYDEHREFAQDLFAEDRDRYHTLRLNLPKPRTVYGWLDQALDFYANLQADREAMLALDDVYGVTSAEIERAHDAVREVSELDIVQEDEKSEAQRATVLRDAAAAELKLVVERLQRVAKRALKGDQRLESLFLRPVVRE